MKKTVYISTFLLCFILIMATTAIVSIPFLVSAYVMGSGTYRMDTDSLNSAGTSFSTSSSYSLGSTLGEFGTGFSSSSAYRMSAGYWTPDDTYISISSSVDANLGAVSGLLGGIGNASSTWTVTTNNSAGYALSVVSGTYPALKAPAAGIDDYVTAGADPDYAFSIPASDARFGFTPEGIHITSRFKDNGSACNTGSGDTADACWDGFATTSKTVSSGSISNHPSGTPTTLKYRVQIGSGKIQDSSPSYEASITVTATAL